MNRWLTWKGQGDFTAWGQAFQQLAADKVDGWDECDDQRDGGEYDAGGCGATALE